ncbi:Crp/Fnr family transcriptional regulator [Hymenobacter sp. H14-R3]|uniref:Crp/Fnr family transcriptional regulator n=1 Tax=Hymenobacter sp. H14-R3 TaxID=3046308 RepID=UPI0024B9F2B0|nr:Crp/Fnr family transcriptional regulator [Hymenobacter sp. H14-R3]MDJ0366805.1 Crp/Fnr family transcriptional regulator [Hymenobacter sp. H14-R3]
MYAALLAHIARYVALTPAETQAVSARFTCQTVPRKAHLFEAGQPCPGNYFVLQGCLRLYFVTEKGVEHITRFALENWWLTDYVSFLSQQPSALGIQAVEPTTVAVLSYQNQEALLAQVPALERYFRLLLQRTAAADQNRWMFQLRDSTEERYWHFSRSFPGFVQRVPQYMLASYLGCTPEFLSKVRAKANSGKATPGLAPKGGIS